VEGRARSWGAGGGHRASRTWSSCGTGPWARVTSTSARASGGHEGVDAGPEPHTRGGGRRTAAHLEVGEPVPFPATSRTPTPTLARCRPGSSWSCLSLSSRPPSGRRPPMPHQHALQKFSRRRSGRANGVHAASRLSPRGGVRVGELIRQLGRRSSDPRGVLMDEFRRPSSSALQGDSRRTPISARMRVVLQTSPPHPNPPARWGWVERRKAPFRLGVVGWWWPGVESVPPTHSG
jgi:hypothetical protein